MIHIIDRIYLIVRIIIELLTKIFQSEIHVQVLYTIIMDSELFDYIIGKTQNEINRMNIYI